ncbi:MAG TPA: hypothetical protein PKZ76_04675 [Xanthomonadaceae bacterium]|nr:hypothetical protein [Xanthomonadaceae bacterium]
MSDPRFQESRFPYLVLDRHQSSKLVPAHTRHPSGFATAVQHQAGRLDEEGDLGLPPVDIVEEPAIGSVQVFLGAILYQAVGGGYSETFRFRTSGPGGDSNVVLVQVQVLDGDVMFCDGFESADI